MIQEARLQKGLTQEELAQKAGTTKSYISKIENNVKEARFSTLQKIVFQHIGFDSVVEMILYRLGKVKKVIVIGDYANGLDTGKIEVIVVGEELNTDYIEQLANKIEKEIKRKVQFYIT